MDLETQLRRLEQQLNAFEKLHANELKDFQEKLAAYMRIHLNEVRLLRDQLDDLKKAVGAHAPVGGPPASSGITRESGEGEAAQHSTIEEVES